MLNLSGKGLHLTYIETAEMYSKLVIILGTIRWSNLSCIKYTAWND